jgi:sugar phosphate permease
MEGRSGEKIRNGVWRFLSYLAGVLKNPQTWIAGIIGCALFMPLTVFADFWGVHYIGLLTGATAGKAAAANGMLYVGWLLGSPLAGHLSDRIGRRKPFLIGSCACSLILLVAMLSARHISLHIFGLLLFMLGLMSSPEVICFTVSGEHNSKNAQGTAIAAVNTIVMLFGGIMQPVVGFILDHCAGRSRGAATTYTLEHFRSAFTVLPLAMALGLALAILMRESGERSC